MRIDTIDLQYLGLPQCAAAFLVRTHDAAALIECGPQVCLANLERGVAALGTSLEAIGQLFVTHIHLDHAGAAGALTHRGLTVHVHPRGAAHLIDPTKLIDSSRRVHGSRFDEHYGEPLAARADRVRSVADGETIALGSLRLTALDTPGHARHHHAWLVEDGPERVCFVGDVAGMRAPGSTFISVPAPPPEFDLEAWRHSLARLRELGASGDLPLLLTHFGRIDDGQTHLDEFSRRIETEVAWLLESFQTEPDDARRLDAYRTWLRPQALDSAATHALLNAFLGETLLTMNVNGVRRWAERR